MSKTAAIVLARGGSKGIPGKNIREFCGKPLLAWTIEQLLEVDGVDTIWVSSDSSEILSIGKAYGAELIQRPQDISGDESSSESGWLHALDYIERAGDRIDVVVAPQVTSPLREPVDIERGIRDFQEQQCDSMFSCCLVEDLCLWERTSDGILKSVNYDYKNRKRRQDNPKQYIENGSFYLFQPKVLREQNNRFGGNIGVAVMESWKTFEIDSMEDFRLCEALMKTFMLNENNGE